MQKSVRIGYSYFVIVNTAGSYDNMEETNSKINFATVDHWLLVQFELQASEISRTATRFQANPIMPNIPKRTGRKNLGGAARHKTHHLPTFLPY